ncbi:3-dehydroquinate synthase [Psychroflexus sp. YR1-1]|uniref:3-dehydroquinate synthase n=1 Tax=Psychroflexus aurantiacus TaxID=2709310 RepID=A0A6B3QY73_9FLAO|nr:3-dehydroquinate synthase [Psychroflexus aurantiacus]NEV93213.1 3-dehydroquinate synthase [Psychroflexus aurantiacus]
MNSIELKTYRIAFQEEAYKELNQLIKSHSYSSIYILVDSNTQHFCSRFLSENIEADVKIEWIEIEPGEEHKNISTCHEIWKTLSETGADRKSLLISLGGGIVTDIGGYAASCFKRGIDFVHVPTTLLGMVDAAIGGKNGVNLDSLKNQIGVINPPQLVLVDVGYLSTLPPEEMRSGLAEMLKHGLIANAEDFFAFEDLSQFQVDKLPELIRDSIQIKTKIAEEDPYEEGLRMALNFGHTLGHAIESYHMESSSKTKLLHGEAVAIGMILALKLSVEVLKFDQETCDKASRIISTYFKPVEFSEEDISNLKTYLKHDKKNSAGNINFVLLEDIGRPKINCKVSDEQIKKAFAYYKSLSK